MEEYHPINLAGIANKTYSDSVFFYTIMPGTNEVNQVKLEDITSFLIKNTELSAVNAKIKSLKEKTEQFIEKMLNTYTTIEFAEREYDKNETEEKVLEATIKTVRDLNSALETIASKTYIEKLQEAAIRAISDAKKECSDVGDSEGNDSTSDSERNNVEKCGGRIMKWYIVKRATGQTSG